MSLLHEGQIIRGTWEVERFIGEGAFAEVYRVKHRFLGRQAMKIFKMIGISVEEIEQMLGEASMLSRIGHPNIVRVFDANITETSRGICGFFTMEYVAGGSLDKFWRSHGAQFVPVETAVEIIRQVCQGLAVAHSEVPPIIHRDIKPQNILVGYDASGIRVRVSDFGLAKRVNPLTLLASAQGTRCFKAPEVFENFQSDSCAGDVWAIGSTLYLLLTDLLPCSDLGEPDLAGGKHFERPMILASHINLQVDQFLDQILLRALAITPEERYPNAKELLKDLKKWKPQSTGKQSENPYLSGTPKSTLGMASPPDEEEARKIVAQALELSHQTSMLKEAADLMEEAFNKWPDLRDQYQYQVKLWRRWIVM